MISFKFGLSLFVVALASQCLALPIDEQLELTTSHSSSADPKYARSFQDQTLPESTTFYAEKISSDPTALLVSRHQASDYESMSTHQSHSPADSRKPEDSSSMTLSHLTPSSQYKNESTQSSQGTTETSHDEQKKRTLEVSPYSEPEQKEDENYLSHDDIPTAQYEESNSKSGSSAPINQLIPEDNTVAVFESSSLILKLDEQLTRRRKIAVDEDSTSTTMKPIGSGEKREHMLVNDDTTMKPTDGAEKHGQISVDEDSTSTTMKPIGSSEKREHMLVNDDTTMKPTDGAEKHEQISVDEDSTSTTMKPVGSGEKREHMPVNEKPISKETSTTFIPVEKLEDVPSKDQKPVDESQKNSSVLDQGKNSPGIEKEESNN